MKACEIKSQKLLRLLAGLKQKRNQPPLGSMDERVEGLVKRFWSKVKKIPNGCWEWQGATYYRGYGSFDFGFGKRAHRFAWMIYRGDIPKGLSVCHTCDNPPCVNPEHLWLGTSKENTADCKIKGRLNPRHGVTHPKAKLTIERVKWLRKMDALGKLNQCKISREWGVRPSSIWKVIQRKSWNHVK